LNSDYYLKKYKEKIKQKNELKKKGRWKQRGVKLKKKNLHNKAPLKFPNLLIK
jgi:hypothetical protein